MTGENLPVSGGKSFEELKQVNQHGAEFWNARDLQPHLGYDQWRRFESAVKKAIVSCRQSGNDPAHHFASAGKMVTLGSGSQRRVDDYQLSRFACYLIAQNGDPRKPEIAQAQKYFAVQTRRQELSDELAADLERMELRKQTSQEFKALSGAAREAGVQDRMFGVFHDAGYKGLYGGLGKEDIKARKLIPPKEQLMDRMGTTELAANQFRMTQTRDKLAREKVRGQQRAIETHNQVGKEVRQAIQRIGGTLPENIPRPSTSNAWPSASPPPRRSWNWKTRTPKASLASRRNRRACNLLHAISVPRFRFACNKLHALHPDYCFSPLVRSSR